MKLFLKIGKLFAILIFSAALLLVVASVLLKDKVGFIILRSINKNLSTRLDVGSYRLSFIRKFPKASLELKDVLVHSSPGLNKSDFPGINTDTLLSARAVSLEFRITDIIRGIYNIERIGAKNGKANFYTDLRGNVNYSISVKSKSHSKEETTIDLRRIYLDEIKAVYKNLEANLTLNGIVNSGKLKTKISGSNIDFTAGTDILVNRFELYNFVTEKAIPTKIDLILQSTSEGITFKKVILHIDNDDIVMDGYVLDNDLLDLNIISRSLDVSKISHYIPEKYLNSAEISRLSGVASASCKISGKLNRSSNPHVDINLQIKNGSLVYKIPAAVIKDLAFKSHFSNGSGNNYETSLVSFSDCKLRLGSSEYAGAFTLKNFNTPIFDLKLKGKVLPGELKEIFEIKSFTSAEGSADVDLNINNKPFSGKIFSTDGIVDLKPEADIRFTSFTLGLQKNNLLFSNVNGNLLIRNSIKADHLQFTYKDQTFKITGDFINLPEWLIDRKVMMTAVADVESDKIIPENYFPEPPSKSSSKKKAISLPSDIRFNINFKIGNLTYRTFASSGVEGNLNYKANTLTFKELKMKSLDGEISGNGFISQNRDKSLMTKGSFIVKGIDVNKAFKTFHDFGQSFLKAENIKGTLSGSLTVLFPVDSLLNFHIKTLTAEGKYHLVNGALINFDPVKQLSSFIELSELENITFDQLDNDFAIRNNMLYIPQMDVKSSAADLSVNGKHSFDNDYEYHVKILLSQILSRKRPKKKSVTEFGSVEDDGLGRTSLLLKIVGNGDDAKVGYDMKAAGTTIKSNFVKEKQSIKTILKQEYGLYKKDTTVNQQPEQKKTKFNVKWDDD